MSFDRVRESSTTTGTGALTLAGAPAGFRGFNTVYAPGGGVPVYYVVEGVTVDGLQTGQWEIGVGALAGDGTLTRGNIVASSNAGALVVFAAGTKRVFDAATVGAVDAMIAAGMASVGVPPSLLSLKAGQFGLPGWQYAGSQNGPGLTAAAASYCVPIYVDDDITLTEVQIYTSTSGTLVDIGIWEINNVTADPGFAVVGPRLANASGINVSVAGVIVATGFSLALTKGRAYLLAVTTESPTTLLGWTVDAPSKNFARRASTNLQIITGISANTGYPAPSTWTATITSTVSNGASGFRAPMTIAYTRGH